MKPFAVVIGGCGCLDGTEVQEAVLTLLYLARAGIAYECVALDRPQSQVINHLTGEPMDEARSMLIEAARISRGEVRSLEQTHADQYAGVIFVGGFGNAMDHSDFLDKRASCVVDPALLAWAQPFAKACKPMGFMCLASALITAICGKGIKQTLGVVSDMSHAVDSMGGIHVACEAGDIVVDTEHQVVSTPLYMNSDAGLVSVALGVERLVNCVAHMAMQMHLGVS